jgi:hypothetical protein
MAQELEVDESTITRWLHDKGKTPVKPIYLKQWALRCGVPQEWLRHGTVTAEEAAYQASTHKYLPDATHLAGVA